MSRFAAMPPPPRFGVPDWEVRMLDAMRQNVELLVNQRRESDQASVAVLESTYDFSTALRPTLLTQYTPQTLHAFSYLNFGQYGNIFTGCTRINDVPGIVFGSSDGAEPFNATLAYNTVPKDVLDDIGTDVRALRATVNEIVTRLRS